MPPSELKRTSAWHAVARNRDKWIAAGPTDWRSGSIIAKPPGQGRSQSGTEVKLAAGQTLDDQHDAGTGWTAESGWLGAIDACCHAEQCTAAFKCFASPAVGEESEVPDAHQTAGENVQQEAAQELMSGNGHEFVLAAVGIISPAEGDALVLKGHEAMVGDGYAMGVAGQVVENMFGAAEGRLGVDDPVLPE